MTQTAQAVEFSPPLHQMPPPAAEREPTYNLTDLSIQTQKEVKTLIFNLKSQTNLLLDGIFAQLRESIDNRQVYVMFEPLLNCDPLTDHKFPKSLLPLYAD